MSRKKFLLVGTVWLSLVSCMKNQAPAKRIELEGINGYAHYYFSRENGKVINVIKQDYTSHPKEYSLSINKDTLTFGEEFIASFAVFRPSFKVIINAPRNETIEGSYDFKLHPEAKGFRYMPDKSGMFILTGQLEYDTLVVPFEYKFIVLPKD